MGCCGLLWVAVQRPCPCGLQKSQARVSCPKSPPKSVHLRLSIAFPRTTRSLFHGPPLVEGAWPMRRSASDPMQVPPMPPMSPAGLPDHGTRATHMTCRAQRPLSRCAGTRFHGHQGERDPLVSLAFGLPLVLSLLRMPHCMRAGVVSQAKRERQSHKSPSSTCRTLLQSNMGAINSMSHSHPLVPNPLVCRATVPGPKGLHRRGTARGETGHRYRRSCEDRRSQEKKKGNLQS